MKPGRISTEPGVIVVEIVLVVHELAHHRSVENVSALAVPGFKGRYQRFGQ
jgi:hypothetical protein